MSTATEEAKRPPKVKTFKVNHEGDIESFPRIPDELISKVIVDAIAKFRLSAQPHQLGLFKKGETEPLDPGITIEKAGVRPNEVLTLRPIVVQGG